MIRTGAVLAAMVALGAILVAAPAKGNEIHGQDYYVAGTLAYAHHTGDINDGDLGTGTAFAFALGREIASEFGQAKAEFELGWMPGDAEEGTNALNALYIMTGARLGFHPEGVNPYIGGGVGLARLSDEHDNDLGLIYQASAGVGYRLSERLEIDLEYRYTGASDAEFDEGGGTFAAHAVGTRVTMRF